MRTTSLPRITAKTPPWLFALCLLSACGGGAAGGGVDPQPEPLTLTGPQVQVGIDQAQLEWSTSIATTAVLEYGENENSLVVINTAPAQTTQDVTLQGLQPSTRYEYRVTVVAPDGRTRTSGMHEFVTEARPAFVSDDFFANNLDPSRWSFLDPEGTALLRMQASSLGTGALELEIPAGGSSAPWLKLTGTRITQTVENQDLALEVTFLGALENEATGQGLVFEQDLNNWARFDFAFNGGKLQLFAAVFENNSLRQMEFSNLQNGAWPAGSPLSMRVTRVGNQYTQQYRLGSGAWVTGPTLSSNMQLAKAGCMVEAEGVGNQGIRSVIDSIQRVDQPLQNEDGAFTPDGIGPLQYGLVTTALDSTTVELVISTDELASAEVRYGQTEALLDGVVALEDLLYRQATFLTGLQPDTQYFLGVVSTDALGHTSSSMRTVHTPQVNPANSPNIALWGARDSLPNLRTVRFGDQGFAQPQVNVLGNVQDADEDRIAQTVSLAYRLNQGVWVPLVLGDDRTINYAPWRLANEGDFNVELPLIDLMSGTPNAGLFEHDLILRATDDDEHVTYSIVRLEIVDGATWSPNYSIDWTSVLNQGGDPTTVCQIVDGDWNVENVPGLGAVLRPDAAAFGYDRLVGIGQGTGAGIWGNYEVSLDATILGLDPQGYTTGTSSYGFGFVMRWTGHTPGGPYSQPNHNIYPLGAGFFYRWFDTRERWELWTGYDEGITPFAGSNLVLGNHYSIKLSCESLVGGGSTYRMKLWDFGTAEPVAWTFEQTTPNTDSLDFGSLLLVAHHADVAFGNIQITQLP